MDDLEALSAQLEGLTVAALLSDLATGAIVSANAEAAGLFGIPVTDVVGAEATSFIHPDERDAATAGVAALGSRVVDSFQVRARHVVRADGSAVGVDISGRRIESPAGPLALWILAAGAEREAPGRSARRATDVVLALTDHDWQLAYISADARLLGPSAQDLGGTPLLGFVHPSGATPFLDATSRAVSERIAVSITARLRIAPDVWTERDCLIVPMCDHQPPRLGLVVTPAVALAGETTAATLAAGVHHAAVAARAVDALDMLATMRGRPAFPELSSRQAEILTRLIRGDPVDDIAAALFLSSSTIRNHLSALYRKFGVHSRAALLSELLRGSSR